MTTERLWLWLASWLAELAMRCYERAGCGVFTTAGGGETRFTIRRRRRASERTGGW